MSSFESCNLDDFLAEVTPQIGSLEDAASATEIIVQQLEGYLQRMKTAVCADVERLQTAIDAIGQGPVGPAGPAGPAGPQGPAGVAPSLEDGVEISSGRTITTNGTTHDTFLKLISVGPLPNTASKNVAHGIPNPFVLVAASGAATDPLAEIGLPLIFSVHTFLSNTVWFNTTSTNVVVTAGNNRTAFTEAFVILEYYYQ